MIGETLTDLENPKPLPNIVVDDPAISMTIGINTSPMAGRVKGAKVTARQVKDRLEQELVGNVSIKVLPTDRPDMWEVQAVANSHWPSWSSRCAVKVSNSPLVNLRL